MYVMKTSLLIVFALLLGLVWQPAVSQTSFSGKVLSVDGRPIPKAAISIQPENQRDIFSDTYDDIFPEKNGSYQFEINDAGLYRIIVKGVFHKWMSIPVMVYDQPSMEMNVLLLPKYFNDGFYFEEENYMSWIRVIGNFNNYSYETGKQFSLNTDGSISAFIPITSDTIRYQVRGLTYGQGSAVLPQADEFRLREDGSFEALLYNDLPGDSLEIRYISNSTIPFQRNLPYEKDPQEIVLNGFLSLPDQKTKNWIWPLSLLQPYNKTYYFIGPDFSDNVPVKMQRDIQKKYIQIFFNDDLPEDVEQIETELSKEELHPQQRVILTMGYASVLGWMARKTLFQQMRSKEFLQVGNKPEKLIPKMEPDSEILLSIPDIVPPFHPAWRYNNNGAVEYLLMESSDPEKFVNYFEDVVRFHPDERAVRTIITAIIRNTGSNYSSVEEMPVYQIIIDRFGEKELARDAHLTFAALSKN